ncbi:MAG: efflux RND transporter periplasmic adaptor subunit [Gammaproteobacteria bacterium]
MNYFRQCPRRRALVYAALVLCAAAPVALAQPTARPQEPNEDIHGAGVLRMDAAERRSNGIVTAPVTVRALTEAVTAPGEVRMNAYRSVQVTPRITAQVIARHARLGDTVTTGQHLVTLSSVTMAEAQGALFEADRGWQRVKSLGREVVSAQRYVAAQVARQRGYATVQAYGMTPEHIEELLQKRDASAATGEFNLVSPQDGIVIRDDFVLGEVVEPGRVLFEITDESVLWVQAQLRPEDASHVTLEMPARITRDGEHWLPGRVIQIHHRLDEITRTQSVRIEMENTDHRLHPGQFVEAALDIAEGAPALVVPTEAVLLLQGMPTVFKLEGDALHPQPVQTGSSRGGWAVIQTGLSAGDDVVIEGGFLVKSLLLKSQLGEGHGH